MSVLNAALMITVHFSGLINPSLKPAQKNIILKIRIFKLLIKKVLGSIRKHLFEF